MIKTSELISETISLPVEVRTLLVNKEIDELWAKEAEKRVEDIRTGKVKTIPGEDVFKESSMRQLNTTMSAKTT